MSDQPVPKPKGRLERDVEFFSIMLSSMFFTSFIPAKLVAKFQLRWGRKSLTEEKWTGAGFVGSLWGMLTYFLLPVELAQSRLVILLGIVTAILFSHIAERALGKHDDSRIVIDEWIGTLLALWMLPQYMCWPVAVSFILFRVFDTLKGPWGHALQKLPGGFGVVLDDVMAGVLANIITRFVLYLFFVQS